jgi:hypothetical protein
MTNPDTTPAENAQIIISVKEGVFFINLKISVNRREIDFFDLDSLDDILQVTPAIIGTKHTPGDFPDFPYGRFKIVTILFFGAHKARIGMLGQNKPEDVFARFAQLRRVGSHFHPLLDIRAARRSETPAALNFDNTQTASPEGFQYRMIA